jgi:hypothetical protein
MPPNPQFNGNTCGPGYLLILHKALATASAQTPARPVSAPIPIAEIGESYHSSVFEIVIANKISIFVL